MIERVLISERVYYAGEQISLIAWGDSPMMAEILCFVRPPSPPTLKPCKECGIFPIQSGAEFRFSANINIFEEKDGHLKVKIVDSTGDSWENVIEIQGRRALATT
jgi:hypothetical protein